MPRIRRRYFLRRPEPDELVSVREADMLSIARPVSVREADMLSIARPASSVMMSAVHTLSQYCLRSLDLLYMPTHVTAVSGYVPDGFNVQAGGTFQLPNGQRYRQFAPGVPAYQPEPVDPDKRKITL